MKLKAKKNKYINKVEIYTKDEIYKVTGEMKNLVSVSTNISVMGTTFDINSDEFKEQFEIVD